MKKKILSLTLVVCLLAIAVVGGTMAYFTDNDQAENVFTVGNVDITLDEDFQQNSQLIPGKDIEKNAKIINKGDNDAWVWAEILVPAALDDGDDNSPNAPGLGNSLHFNFPGANTVEWAQDKNPNGDYYNADMTGLWITQYDKEGVINDGFAGSVVVDGVTYNKHVLFYKDALEAGQETSLFLTKAYMDKGVKQCTTEGHAANCFVLLDGKTHYTGDWNILVRVFAIQEEGIDSVTKAWELYDGVKPVETPVV